MRSVPVLALVCASFLATTFSSTSHASTSHAATLHVDTGLLVDVADTLSQARVAAPLPLLEVIAAGPRSTASDDDDGPRGGRVPPQLSGVGVGLQVGSPTALTLKFSGVQQDGVVVGIGAAFSYGRTFGTSMSLHVDYLFHLFTLFRNAQVAMTAYAGPGVWLALFGSGVYGLGYGFNYVPGFAFFGVGVRVPLGVSMAFPAAPVEIYLELDPTVFIFPGIDPGVGASLGFRYHF